MWQTASAKYNFFLVCSAKQNPSEVYSQKKINNEIFSYCLFTYTQTRYSYLRSKGMTQGVVDYLMWHHFGRNPEERNHDLAQVCVFI